MSLFIQVKTFWTVHSLSMYGFVSACAERPTLNPSFLFRRMGTIISGKINVTQYKETSLTCVSHLEGDLLLVMMIY